MYNINDTVYSFALNSTLADCFLKKITLVFKRKHIKQTCV